MASVLLNDVIQKGAAKAQKLCVVLINIDVSM